MASKISAAEPLLLGSGSPRRREMLCRIGIPIVTRGVDVDERVHASEAPEHYLERIVACKAEAAFGLMAAPAGENVELWHAAAAVLVADTVVVHSGAILGKPTDDADAENMLWRLSGTDHFVATRFSLCTRGGLSEVQTVRTRVRFRALEPRHVEAYVRTGEGRDKAGAYGIQGIGAWLVEHIDGDYSNVVGLPLCAVVKAMEALELITECPVVT